jgi:adenylate cyclase class 2
MMQEIEAKYYVRNLPAVEAKIISGGGTLLHARIHETNLRFDTPDGDLSRQYQMLRLRKTHTVTITFKGSASVLEGVSRRQEIETEMGDFEIAKSLLEALGYQVTRIYEKYRTEYQLDGLTIALDELPYGNFVEIEGTGPEKIRQAAARLGLDPAVNIPANYLMLLDRFNKTRGLMLRDLTFENLRDLVITPEDLDVIPAD